MNFGRLKQFAVILAVIWSLAVSSSAAACACPHHHEKAAAQMPPCHHGSSMTMTDETPEADQKTAFETVISESGCGCVQSVPRVFGKNDSLKIEKQTAAVLPSANVEIKPAATLVSFVTIRLAPPLYLSDSFYNFPPGRAPPRS